MTTRQDRHINDMDRLFWAVERDPQLRNTMTAVLVLDRAPDRAVVLERMERASRVVPGWRHRLVAPPLNLANPRWVVDPDFDLNYHVRWVGAPSEGTVQSVLEFARATAVTGLDKQRPLWSVTVVEGLAGGGAVVVIKVHHVLIDGYGGIGMLPVIVDLTPEPADLGPLPPVPEQESLSRLDLAVDAVLTTGGRLTGFAAASAAGAARRLPRALRDPRGALVELGRDAAALRRIAIPALKPLSPLMTARRGWNRWVPVDVDLPALKAAARTRGASVNDAFLAGVGYGVALYHERRGAPVTRLRTVMAITYRSRGDGGPDSGNHVLGGHFVIPVGTDDVTRLLAAMGELARRARGDAERRLIKTAVSVATATGPLLADYVGALTKHCDLLLSNIPGIDAPLWFGGAAVTALYGFGPVMGTALNATLVSYNGTAHIALNVDTSAVDDLDLLVECVREAFDAILALAQE